MGRRSCRLDWMDGFDGNECVEQNGIEIGTKNCCDLLVDPVVAVGLVDVTSNHG